jgi:hypothetical protein
MCFPHEKPCWAGSEDTSPLLCRTRVVTGAERAYSREQPKIGKVLEVTMPKITTLRAVARRAPTIENGKVASPRRQPNQERRTREHLTPHEVDRAVPTCSRPSATDP